MHKTANQASLQPKLHERSRTPPMGTCGNKLDLSHVVAKKRRLLLAIAKTTFKYANYAWRSTGYAKRCHHAP